MKNTKVELVEINQPCTGQISSRFIIKESVQVRGPM